MRAENAQLPDGARRFRTIGGPVGHDEVSVARFVADQSTMHRVPHTVTCATPGISISWFHKWIGREPTDRQRRRACSGRDGARAV